MLFLLDPPVDDVLYGSRECNFRSPTTGSLKLLTTTSQHGNRHALHAVFLVKITHRVQGRCVYIAALGSGFGGFFRAR